jgi:hypothetical protein
MDWVNLLKTKQIVTPTTDIGIKKVPKKKKDSNECNERLKAYADKIKNTDISYFSDYETKSYWQLRNSSVEKKSQFMMARWAYKPIPEEVACAVLDLLDEFTTAKRWSVREKVFDKAGKEWSIFVKWNVWKSFRSGPLKKDLTHEPELRGELVLRVYKFGLSSLFGNSEVNLSIKYRIPMERHRNVIKYRKEWFDNKINWRDN